MKFYNGKMSKNDKSVQLVIFANYAKYRPYLEIDTAEIYLKLVCWQNRFKLS